jgi:hypothetical protein
MTQTNDKLIRAASAVLSQVNEGRSWTMHEKAEARAGRGSWLRYERGVSGKTGFGATVEDVHGFINVFGKSEEEAKQEAIKAIEDKIKLYQQLLKKVK